MGACRSTRVFQLVFRQADWLGQRDSGLSLCNYASPLSRDGFRVYAARERVGFTELSSYGDANSPPGWLNLEFQCDKLLQVFQRYHACELSIVDDHEARWHVRTNHG